MKRWLEGRKIAHRYLPDLWLCIYVAGKLRFDSVYIYAEEALRGSERDPGLDPHWIRRISFYWEAVRTQYAAFGCGVGLLPTYLRSRGYRAPIRAFDMDEQKIKKAQRASQEKSVEFFAGDAAKLPPHEGDVVMLDILHYFDEAQRRSLLEDVARRIQPGGVALIRNGIHERNWRFALTVIEEWLIGLSRWIPRSGWHFPRREEICQPFIEAGFSVRVREMKGLFNSYFFEFRRET